VLSLSRNGGLRTTGTQPFVQLFASIDLAVLKQVNSSVGRWHWDLLPAALAALPSVLFLGFLDRLPGHITRVVRSMAGERDNVIDHIAGAAPASLAACRARVLVPKFPACR
jgi:hypothetical protein